MGQQKQKERGMALVLTLIALLIITSIGLTMMYSTDTETSINGNYRDEQTAYYAAKAGLEEVRDRMQTGAANTISANLPTAMAGAAGGELYIINPNGSETVAPWLTTNAYFDDEICKEVNCSGGQVPPTSGWYTTANASSTYAATPVLPYKWMRISLKTDGAASGWSGATRNSLYVDGNSANAAYYVCWNGTNEITQAAACAEPYFPVYIMTALAITPSGTRRMLQYEVTQDTLNLSFGAALTLDGTGDSMVGGPSAGFGVNGNDSAGCGGTAVQSAKAAIGVPDNSDIAPAIAGLPKPNNYVGSNAAPDVENIGGAMPSVFQSVSSINAYLATVKSNATQVYNSSQTSLVNTGTAASPQIIYINGDYSPSGTVNGYGILVVTGTYSPGGNVGWNGIVLVVGKGIMTGNGGGNSVYTGAVVVAQTVDSSGNPLPTLGSASFNFSGGGGNGVNYSSGCILAASHISDYRMVSTRELMY